MICKHCRKKIYSAGGDQNEGQFGWLHTHSGSAKCDQPEPPRAEPLTSKRPEITKELAADACFAFIRTLDPLASFQNGLCQAEIGGTIISANLGDRFESVRSVYRSAVEKVERRGLELRKH